MTTTKNLCLPYCARNSCEAKKNKVSLYIIFCVYFFTMFCSYCVNIYEDCIETVSRINFNSLLGTKVVLAPTTNIFLINGKNCAYKLFIIFLIDLFSCIIEPLPAYCYISF